GNVLWLSPDGGGPHLLMRHHDGEHDLMARLKLTPEQQGEVHVFQESMMQKMRTEMSNLRQQMDALLTPDQKAQMKAWHGQWHHFGPPPPPSP
ncbi:MAG: hypothetical protein ACYCW6_19865, partial [Candidatus Xenobia bacterium]